MTKRSNTVRNRSQPFGVKFVPFALDKNLPIHVIAKGTKGDTAIRFLHVHNCLEIGLCHEGSGIMIVGDKTLSYQAGDVTFINHTEVHFSRSAKGTISRWTWVMLDPMRLVPGAPMRLRDVSPLAGATFANLFSPARNPELAWAVARLISETQYRPAHWESAVRALVWTILILVWRSSLTSGLILFAKGLILLGFKSGFY